MQFHTVALILSPINWKDTPSVPQTEAKLHDLHEWLNTTLQAKKFNVFIQMPNLWMDLRATSSLQQLAPSALSEEMVNVRDEMDRIDLLAKGSIVETESARRNAPLNATSHMPAVLYFTVSGEKADLFRWHNEALVWGMHLGNREDRADIMVLTKKAHKQLTKLFAPAQYDPVVSFMPLNAKTYPEMLLEGMRKHDEAEETASA